MQRDQIRRRVSAGSDYAKGEGKEKKKKKKKKKRGKRKEYANATFRGRDERDSTRRKVRTVSESYSASKTEWL
jgi:DNA invertase Pin-like site-specific DNA recombinase